MPHFNPANPRYKGKAFLRFLEFYVLWAIGQLSEKESAFMIETTPMLRSTFHRDGTWQSIIEAEMEFPPELPGKIRELWNRNCEIACQRGISLSAQWFAEVFVDQNLVI